MSNDLTRRSFVKWGTAAAGAATLAGFTGCAPSGQEDAQKEGLSDTGDAPAEETGVWLTGACMNNCSCNASRCLLKVYVAAPCLSAWPLSGKQLSLPGASEISHET